jgi:hypothetical protein
MTKNKSNANLSGKTPAGKSGNAVRDQHEKLRDEFASPESAHRSDAEKSPVPESVAERLTRIDAYARENPGQPVSSMLRKLFPALTRSDALQRNEQSFPPLPQKAPELWTSGKRSRETPPAFIARVYKPWLGKITRVQIGKLDARLYEALNFWLRSNEMPPELDLPTVEEANDRWVRRILSGDSAAIAELNGPDAYRNLERLVSAVRRRAARR